jgi:hypothetical protein
MTSSLIGNFFSTLPYLPPTICVLRLSVTGQENIVDLIKELNKQRRLISIHLHLSCYEEDAVSFFDWVIDKKNDN